jgi:hypothetical protein
MSPEIGQHLMIQGYGLDEYGRNRFWTEEKSVSCPAYAERQKRRLCDQNPFENPFWRSYWSADLLTLDVGEIRVLTNSSTWVDPILKYHTKLIVLRLRSDNHSFSRNHPKVVIQTSIWDFFLNNLFLICDSSVDTDILIVAGG